MNLDKAIIKLRRFYKNNKRLPSYQEMADLFGFASKRASQYLADKLIKAGLIAKDNKGKLIPKNLLAFPILGTIHAGQPAPAYEQNNLLNLADYLTNYSNSDFALTVRGDSMIEEGIHDGDIVIVDKNQTPKNGSVVVAYIDNEWTVKYFFNEDGEVLLVPANPKYRPITPKFNLEIAGVVKMVIRKYN